MYKKSVLENWIIFDGRITGDIYGDNRFKEGQSIVSSKIIYVETENTIYKLGKPASGTRCIGYKKANN